MKLANDVHQAIQAAVIDGREVRLTGQLDRKLYVAVDKALQAAGGRWNRKAGAHVFDSDALPVIAAMLDEGEIATAQETGFFPSPPPVVSRLLQLAAVEPGMTALEPSAGTGSIADALAEAGAIVDCIEVDPRLVEKLTIAGHDVTGGSFLDYPPLDVYDRIVMNPPFARKADVAHVEHALRFLQPGGRLVSVMAGGFAFREDKATAALRDRATAIEQLPEDSFRESGTSVRTVIVTFDLAAG